MAQRIAVVDSANGSIIEATVSLQARGTPIRGAFTVFMTDSDVVLGRISKTALTNPFHENPLFAPLIMTKGSIPFWSGDVDIEKATIEIISVKDRKTMERIPLRRNPPSGTDVYLADQATMEQFAVEREHFLVLGHVPNSDGLLCSVVNRNYAPAFDLNGEYDLGGYGEARHMGIFGQNGSAETILLTTTAAGRLAAHPQMGSLILDTSGDLADPTRHSRGKYRWNYDDVLKAVNLTMERIPIADIQLTSTDTLVEKLHPVLRKRINMGPEHARKLADAVVVDLFGMNDVNANQIQTSDILELAKRNINGCYSSTTKGRTKTLKISSRMPPELPFLIVRSLRSVHCLQGSMTCAV